MRLEFFIAFRYLLAKQRQGLVSVAGIFAVIGVWFGVLVPIVVMAVMNGFQDELKKKILGLQSHLILYAPVSSITNYKKVIEEIESMAGAVSASAVIEQQSLIKLGSEYSPVLVRGIEQRVFTADKDFAAIIQFTKGNTDLSAAGSLLMGEALAERTFVYPGDPLSLISAKSGLFKPLSPITIPVTVQGLFKTGYYEHDRQVVYTSLAWLQKYLDKAAQADQIEIKIADAWEAENFATELKLKYGRRFAVSSWQSLNMNMFQALKTERILLWFVVVLILFVAIFNVMSSQIMLVLEKKKEIGILKTLGMKPIRITQIFLFEGLITTLFGATAGAAAGHWLSKNIAYPIKLAEFLINLKNSFVYQIVSFFSSEPPVKPAEVILFSPDVYTFTSLPVDPSITRAVIIWAAALLLSAAAGVIPSVMASKLKPVEVIRYE